MHIPGISGKQLAKHFTSELMGNEPSGEAVKLLTEMFRERIAQVGSKHSIEHWAKRVLTETNAIDFAAFATENTDLKRQLAAGANAYGMQLETIAEKEQQLAQSLTKIAELESYIAHGLTSNEIALQLRLDEAFRFLDTSNNMLKCFSETSHLTEFQTKHQIKLNAAFLAAQRKV
jgi:hypothetical protein